jgi:hypothetical protein
VRGATHQPTLSEPLAAAPTGRWTLFSRGTATAETVQLVDEFEPLENEGGARAARWLREEALNQDGITKTHLLVSDGGDEILGFFACCYSQVDLTEKSLQSLGLRTKRKRVPAFLVCWIARARERKVGINLMATAYGLAQDVGSQVGLVALVLDPLDLAVAEMWRSDPYFFQDSETRSRKGGPPRLWLPI